MNIQIDKRFQKRIKGTFEKYEFEVGILEDKAYRKPLRGERGLKGQDVLTNYAGMKVRKASRKKTEVNLSDISKENRDRYDYLQKPFKKMSPEIEKLFKDFIKFVFGKTEAKRLQNTLQAVVRNPIRSKMYGQNSQLTQKIKGFDHVMMDTAQFFKAIRARVVKKKRGLFNV